MARTNKPKSGSAKQILQKAFKEETSKTSNDGGRNTISAGVERTHAIGERQQVVVPNSGYMGTKKKEAWSAEKQMAAKRKYAQSQGKGNWNAEAEMKKRREAAAAQGKGKWNAQEEMRKRREAAAARKAKG